MKTTKLHRPLEQLQESAELLKALAHPVRLGILQLLTFEPKMTVSEIQEALSLEQAVASQHLIMLRNKGILTVAREGKNAFYALRYPCLSQLLTCVDQCKNK